MLKNILSIPQFLEQSLFLFPLTWVILSLRDLRRLRLPDPAGEEADAVPHPGTFSQKGPRERKKIVKLNSCDPLSDWQSRFLFSQFNFAATRNFLRRLPVQPTRDLLKKLMLSLFHFLLFFSHQVYLPSCMFVVVSWVSFLIKPEVVPGRMALLVTLFLVLINIFNSVR